jgi:branched-subunit amino acid transport protein
MTWAAVLSLAAGTYLIRLSGLLLRGRVSVPAWVERYLDLGATALLVALVALSTCTQGGGFAGWARPLGVLVGAVAAWRKVPFVLVVILAAGTTALLRLAGLS